MSHIVPMILNAMLIHLELKLQTELPSNERVGLIKVGRFQENPTKVSTYISLAPGDPDDPNYQDGIASIKDIENIGLKVDAREIGGGELWWRRFTATVGCYWIEDRLDEDEALEQSYLVMGRLCNAIPLLNIGGLIDQFGEEAQYPFLYATTNFEGGGQEKYIWRGKAKWQVLTYRS